MSGDEHPRRYLIVGLSRLTVQVARRLHAGGAAVVVVTNEAGPLLPRVREVAEVVVDDDLAGALTRAGVDRADALLALADDDLENLRAVGCAGRLAPDLAIVLRSFDAALAERLEADLNVRRAYSLSALSAPAFVAAILGAEALETLRLGDGHVAVFHAVVSPGSKLSGATPATVLAASGCTVLAGEEPDGAWADPGEKPLAPGTGVIVGGPMIPLLRLLVSGRPVLPARPPRRDRVRLLPRRRRATFVPLALAALVAFLLVATAVFGRQEGLGPIDSLYFTFVTGLGDGSLYDANAGLQVFGLITMVAIGALIGVLYSHLAAVATAERLEGRMARRAGRMRNHVVVAGLGTVGYRIESLLSEIGLDVVVLEQSADSRFVDAVRARTPVVPGDARMVENLAKAGIERAACLVAVTDDDLVNVVACLHGLSANPGLRTVARIFDDTIVENGGPRLGIDAIVSASQVAAAAFAGAATDERAVRAVQHAGLDLAAARHELEHGCDPATVAAWRADRVRVIAAVTPGSSASAAGDSGTGLGLEGLPAGSMVIVAGPDAAVRRIVRSGS